MKIAIVSAGVLPLPPVKGGATENLIEHFVTENEKKEIHDLILYSCYDSEAEKKSLKYKKVRFKYIKTDSVSYKFGRALRYSLKTYLKLNIKNQFISEVIKDLKKQEYDLVIIENKPEFALALKKIAKGKIIQHLHNDYLSFPLKQSHEILEASEKVIVVSDYIKKSLAWYINSSKISTLYNCIEVNKFSKKKWIKHSIEFRAKLGISENDIVILYSGRLTEQKGIKELVEAFKEIKNTNIKLLIVGASWYSSDLNDDFSNKLKKSNLGWENKIIFTGYINYESMPIVYSCSDIVVMPSIGVEAAGLVAIEARASEVPLIISDSGGIFEYVNEDCSVIVQINKDMTKNLKRALIDLVSNKDLRDRMSFNSRSGIELFDNKSYYNNFNILLNEVYKNYKNT